MLQSLKGAAQGRFISSVNHNTCQALWKQKGLSTLLLSLGIWEGWEQSGGDGAGGFCRGEVASPHSRLGNAFRGSGDTGAGLEGKHSEPC